jgi:hypothetical protein
MSDETADRSAGAVDGPGHTGGGPGQQSPLQTRAAFLKNRSWEFVVSLNRGACERGRAQHGFNRETQETTKKEWEAQRNSVCSLDETIEFLRYCHRRAPFLFFNGNTFADIGRQIAAALFADLPAVRLREVTSAIAHCIAGVLDHDAMAEIVEGLCESADFHPGDRVRTFRGSMRGTILRLEPDGRVVWRTDAGAELIALPEALLREKATLP